MKISLESARARSLFLASILIVACSLVSLGAKISLAALSARSWTRDGLLRATKLEPGNAVYWYHLGLYENWNLGHPDLRQAVAYYRQATEANPRSDTYWMSLADAYEAIGQPDQADGAFKNARSAHPISSDVAWRYGNFLLRQQNYPEAFAEIRRALITDPTLTSQAVSECSRITGDVAGTLESILPGQSAYYETALGYFISQNQTDAALIAWNRLLQLKPSLKMQQTVPLADMLLHEQQVGDAVTVWRQALAATAWPDNANPNSSLVFNGGFEHELLNGGFDWREDTIAGATYSSDTSIVRTGARSVRVTFDGSANINFQHLWEFIPVEPNRSYRFAAYLRLDQISTDSGIRFLIFDPFHPAAPQIQTPSLVGSQPWSPVEQDFVTGPETHLIVIALRRAPSWKFDNKLSGTVWVDDVSLILGPEDAHAGSQ
jgi:tetratricopeptide (TPR) repeat protein